ncbi:uncharacterized protein LOC100569778 [Acyrthosiphon pisum]|uniref:Uncharacterized protein n=1 Tax=Acyrthosiphon pisum TaxID=7029 RepID=A0A8R2ABA7_ACYPI|nr:uncharacterized protein LOC100569778 [Acyrthosiphon pisum]|eukprot:XP_003242643.1 PREDICTED: uncharacterized protein LOC100569778 [Acyrthosiphon pisum]
MERYNDYRNRMMRRSVRQYFHFVYYNPRLICRIMSSVNGVFFMALSMILVYNILCDTYFKQQSSSTSKPSKDEVNYDLDLQLPVGLVYKNERKVITKSLFNLIFTLMMLLVNIRLLYATYKRNLYSISIWLFVHTTHMLYSLSVNLWVGASKGYNSLIYLAMFNTLIYFLFISLVALFWMEERCINHMPRCINDKAATSQERKA